MFDWTKKSYKSRNQIILLVALLFGIVCYFFAINKTWSLISDNSKLEQNIEMLKSAPQEITNYTSELETMNNSLGYVGSKEQLSKEFILDFVSNYTDTSNVFLMTMPKTRIEDKNGYQLETNILELQGNFKDLVLLIYQIEYKYKISKITSTQYKINTDIYTKKKDLSVVIHLQNIII